MPETRHPSPSFLHLPFHPLIDCDIHYVLGTKCTAHKAILRFDSILIIVLFVHESDLWTQRIVIHTSSSIFMIALLETAGLILLDAEVLCIVGQVEPVPSPVVEKLPCGLG